MHQKKKRRKKSKRRLNKLVDARGESSENGEMKGTVVLMKKNMMDLNDVNASIVDGVDESLGKKISFQLVSINHSDPSSTEGKGKLGRISYLEKWQEKSSGLIPSDLAFEISFDWDDELGAPGAVIVRNEHQNEFYLRTFTLGDVPGQKSTIHFVCNSWVYPTDRYKRDRLFFTNQVFRPEETPKSLRKYREEELETLRGSGSGELKEWDRVYDYAYYNDLGEPDRGPEFSRPVLGGSPDYPFPRRGRTSRPPTTTDPNTESRLPIAKSLGVYVPRDEKFGHLKMSDFVAYALKSMAQDFIAGMFNKVHENPLEFSSFRDELDLYEGGIDFPDGFEKMWESIPFEFLKAFLQNDGSPFLKYPLPQIIKEDTLAWRYDEEFAREMLAGMHPLMIRLLEEFPPKSKLDPDKYGNQNSTITNTDIEKNLDGIISVDEAVKMKKLFILEHHDTLMPFLRKINSTLSKVYATRTILFLKEDGTLKPLAIELSLPHPDGDKSGAVSKVVTPAQLGIEGSIWNLAKAYVVVTDQSCHQLYSHWALTHMVVEPFVIATHRQLSVVHPIYKLLKPHFKDTMFINAVGRQSLLNAEGALEQTLFHGHYSMGWASSMYREWVFTDQALPRDLLKRGMASENSQSPFGYKLAIEDYPYAVDGLEIWFAIETWVRDYSSFYYGSDEKIAADIELQSWWKEIREVGHGDKKDEKWWPEMKTLNVLIETCTTIIWVASALHSALNFGQYPYGGYHPNRPTVSRRFMPEPGTPEYAELLINPDKVFLKTISNQVQTLLGLDTIELLSRHASDEVYLGGGNPEEYILDAVPLGAFDRFRKKLLDVEFNITARNANEKLKNRAGPVKMPYTLLCPTSGIGLTGRGIANSISI